jgi:hypothetical protein
LFTAALSPILNTISSPEAAVTHTGFSNGYARSVSPIDEPASVYATLTLLPDVGRTLVRPPPVVAKRRSPAFHVCARGFKSVFVDRVSTEDSVPALRTLP